MKFYFVMDASSKRHVVVGESKDEAVALVKKAGLEISTIYEMTSTTYNTPGFLISDK